MWREVGYEKNGTVAHAGDEDNHNSNDHLDDIADEEVIGSFLPCIDVLLREKKRILLFGDYGLSKVILDETFVADLELESTRSLKKWKGNAYHSCPQIQVSGFLLEKGL